MPKTNLILADARPSIPVLDPLLEILRLRRYPNRANGNCALESSIQADKGSSALPDELAVLILRSDCMKLVQTLATDGSKETKALLATHFEHGTNDELSQTEIDDATLASTLEWIEEMEQDHVPADLLMLMAICTKLDIGMRIHTDEVGFTQDVIGLDLSKPPSAKIIDLAYFRLQDEVNLHR